MTMSSSTFLLDFSVNQFIPNMHILMKKNHVKIFCSETFAEMNLGWPTFKIMCDISPSNEDGYHYNK